MILVLFLTSLILGIYILLVYWGEDFYLRGPAHDGWFHVVFNYIGPRRTQGISIYTDGIELGCDLLTENIVSHVEGDGRIVFGRFYTDEDARYATVQIDQLLFFNHALTAPEIFKLSQIST